MRVNAKRKLDKNNCSLSKNAKRKSSEIGYSLNVNDKRRLDRNNYGLSRNGISGPCS